MNESPGITNPKPDLRARLREYYLLMRMDKPIGTLLLLWPTLWALWIAGNGQPDPLVLMVFVAGVFLMRSAGCVINDFADRNIDGQVERTQHRPLAQKRIASKEAVALFIALALTAFLLVLLMNPLTIALSFVGALLAASYPFMKRFTHLPQLVLGAAFGWAVPMAFAAQTNSLPVQAWILFALTLIWTTAYDTQYAMVDREDDLKIGVKSTAILFGKYDRLIIGLLQAIVIVGLITIGMSLELRWPYYLGIGAAALFAVYQQWLIRNRDRQHCFRAFLNNNYFGMSVFAGIALSYLL
jgi:4-hydroxybenzoate polyprenyltransferase